MNDRGVNVPLILTDARMDCNGWEVAGIEQLAKFIGTGSALDEDDDLLEGKRVEEPIQFSVLLILGKLDGVLLKAVKGNLFAIPFVAN